MTEKNVVKKLVAKASDGNTTFAPRQMLERFLPTVYETVTSNRPYTTESRRYTDTEWTTKGTAVQEDFIW